MEVDYIIISLSFKVTVTINNLKYFVKIIIIKYTKILNFNNLKAFLILSLFF